VARAADSDELRSQARLAAEKWDIQAAERLAGLPEVSQLPAPTLVNLAMVIYFRGGQQRALRLMVDAQRRHPDSFRLNLAVANYYTRPEMNPPQWAEAAHYAWIAVALRPKNAYARTRIADMLEGQGNTNEAVAQYRKAIELDPKTALAHNNLGVILSDQGKWDEAVAEFRTVIDLDPKDASAHANLGTVLRDQGKLPEAVAECRTAIDLDPNLAAAHLNLGIALHKQGKLDEADTECYVAVGLEPRHAGDIIKLLGIPGFGRGTAYAQRGEWDKAAADFAAVFNKKPPNNPYLWLDYAFVRLQVGDAAGYSKLCRQMRERFGNSQAVDEVAMLALTCVLAAGGAGDDAGAIRLAERRLALTPRTSAHHAWSMHVMGLAYYRAGQDQKAIEWLSKGLKEHPDCQFSFVLAMAHHRLGQGEEGRKWFDKAEQWIKEKVPYLPNKRAVFAPPGWHWHSWIATQLFKQEAEEVFRKEAGDRSKAKPM
jgi:tetratricopeptide (TPR) repeat protein